MEVRRWERFRTRAAYTTATTSMALLPGTTDLALGATWALVTSLEGTRGRGRLDSDTTNWSFW